MKVVIEKRFIELYLLISSFLKMKLVKLNVFSTATFGSLHDGFWNNSNLTK